MLLIVVAILASTLPAAAEEGAMWVPALPSRYQGFNDLSLFSDGTGYSFRSNGNENGPLFVTKDFGVTWGIATVPPFGGTGRIRFGSPSVGYGVDGSVFRSTDGGASWADVTLPGNGYAAVDDFEVVDADTLVLGRTVAPPPQDGEECTPPGLRRPEIAITHDGGTTWTTQQLADASLKVRAIAMQDDRVALLTSPLHYDDPESCYTGGAGAAPDTVWVLDQESGEYRAVFTCESGRECRDLAWAGDVLIAVTNYGWVNRSADMGETWTSSRVLGVVSSVNVPSYPYTGGFPDGIAFADDQVGYASFTGNGIWRTTDAGLTWEMETSPGEVPGLAFGAVAVADADHALAGGPNAIYRRMPPR